MLKKKPENEQNSQAIINLIEEMELWNQQRDYVETEEYENWLVSFLDTHKFLSDFEDDYIYNKPDYITDADMNNINSLSDFWDYKNSNKEIERCDESNILDFTILPDITIIIKMQNKEYEFERIAGCGCYVYTIEVKE